MKKRTKTCIGYVKHISSRPSGVQTLTIKNRRGEKQFLLDNFGVRELYNTLEENLHNTKIKVYTVNEKWSKNLLSHFEII